MTESLNLDEYIMLPAENYGGINYPDIEIGINRLSCTPEVQRVSELLGVEDIKNNERGYIELEYGDAIDLNRALGNFTLPLTLFREYLRLLRDGVNGERNVYDEKGNKIKKQKVQNVYEDIIKMQDPVRSEWINNRFFIDLDYVSSFIAFQLVPISAFYPKTLKGTKRIVNAPGPISDDILVKHKKIDFEYWLNNATREGFPLNNSPDGKDFDYHHPIHFCCYRFSSSSAGRSLHSLIPDLFSATLLSLKLSEEIPKIKIPVSGVRPARIRR